ncbi:MAG: enoyl-CoA hydratase/isomerase family protein [Candidatus Bathyarchaeota archaeon]
MNYKEIVYEVKDNICTITLNTPEKHNRLTKNGMRELISALETAKDDGEVRVIILTGAGDKAFCAGAEISEYKGLNIAQIRDKNAAYCKLCKTFTTLGKPCIAAVNGYALAGGCGLAILPDITIASENAKIGVPAAKIGMMDMMVSAGLRRAVGRKKALEMLLFGDMIDAHEAERIGLFNKVVPAGKLTEEVMKMAHRITEESPIALKLGLEAFYTSEDMENYKALDYLCEMAAMMTRTEDSQEGVLAFFEKRKPVWKGK